MNVYQLTLPAPKDGSTPLQKFVIADDPVSAINAVEGTVIGLQFLGTAIVVKKDSK